MTTTSARVMWATQVLLGRAHHQLGWAGLTGVLLIVAAAGLLLGGQPADPMSTVLDPTLAARALPDPELPAQPARSMPDNVMLLPLTDASHVVMTIRQAAVANGLGWPAAEYRVAAATPGKPASLEVRCTLKGPYLGVRRMLTALTGEIPGFVLRELSFSRPTPDAAHIEASLTMAVYLLGEVDEGSVRALEQRR